MMLLPTLVLLLASSTTTALQKIDFSSRRSFLAAPASVVPLLYTGLPSPAVAADLQFSTSASGIQWADAKVGSGGTKKKGESVAIDYAMSTTGARYGSKIYSNKDSGVPYRWVLGDGSTILGLEEAIIGSNDVLPMQPGGVRRVIVPAELAYASLAKPIPGMQFQECQEGTGVGPIPPSKVAGEEFNRFRNIYCNANRPYQPDLVLDIKMYGKRASE